MVELLWMFILILLFIIILLLVKISLLQKTAGEICDAFEERLKTDTNTLIDISSRDRHMRKLAAAINVQLRKLRKERHRFQQGDLELKEAVTNISHDLRTPLTAICGYLDLLEKEEKSETVSRYLSQIENRTEALIQLTEELFRYSIVTSTRELHSEKIDLRRTLEDSLLSYYGAMQQKGITPDIHLPEIPIWRTLDITAVSRIFSNIISNALKYSDGDLSVSMDDKGSIVFSNTAKSLTGVTAGKLFNRFYTVEASRNSTGLGLSIAKLLTERMGGTIAADYREETLSIVVDFPQTTFL